MVKTTCCTQMAMGRGTKINTCHTRSAIIDQSAAAARYLSLSLVTHHYAGSDGHAVQE